MNHNTKQLTSDEIRMCHLSCISWFETINWIEYFKQVQILLKAEITHLDKNDPVRRRIKTGDFSGMSSYVTSFDKSENCHWVFGKLDAIGIDFTIQHYRENHNMRGWANSIEWYFPAEYARNISGLNVIEQLFNLGNTSLSTFYSYCDISSFPSSKKKQSGAINIQSELVGVFWLTYFDFHYVNFIGKDNITSLDEIDAVFNHGVTLRLADSPFAVQTELRNRIEMKLGSKLFVQNDDKELFPKRVGEYALTFDQLRTCDPNKT